MPDRILIVDDDDLLCASLCIGLRDRGYETIACTFGEDALRLALSEQPHLIVLDVLMPGLNGFAILAKLKAQPRLCAIPVLMLTSQRSPTQVLEARDLGASAYVAKPIDASALAARIRQLLAPRAVSIAHGVEWLD